MHIHNNYLQPWGRSRRVDLGVCAWEAQSPREWGVGRGATQQQATTKDTPPPTGSVCSNAGRSEIRVQGTDKRVYIRGRYHT